MNLVKFTHVIAISTVILALQVACSRINTTKKDNNKKSELFGKDIIGTEIIELSLSDAAATAGFAGNCYVPSHRQENACAINKESTVISGEAAKKNGSAAAPVIDQPAYAPK